MSTGMEAEQEKWGGKRENNIKKGFCFDDKDRSK